ncbi:MAG TPA: VanZ family protein [Candidatus Mediterraneibacter merdigallinarum]|nr:VanZ family protein [Candidatus Mediterraneibacter merdigallinarum]
MEEEKKNSVRTEIFLPWLTAALYAATDEVHQLFVPGRSGQISDVILDSAGALAGVLVLAAVRKLIKRKQNFRKAVYVRK